MFSHNVLFVLLFISTFFIEILFSQSSLNETEHYRRLTNNKFEKITPDEQQFILPENFNIDLTIDLRTIDTSQYSSLYTFWSEVPVGSPLPVQIKDTNRDSRQEIYGYYSDYHPLIYQVIYEININGSYDSVYKYPESIQHIAGITDLENDNFYEAAALCWTVPLYYYITILENDPVTGYPTKVKTIYDPTTALGQPARINFYDIDSDGYPEMIYYLEGEGDTVVQGRSYHIAEYDRINNKFNVVYQNSPSNHFTKGYAFGDFNSNGKQNFAVSGWNGEIFVYEHVEGNDYKVDRIDSVSLSNVFLQLFTNDLDKNGKPELWIGGDAYFNGIPSTCLYIYESEDDKYKITYVIAIIGASSFFANNIFAADIDMDNTEEVLLCIDQHLLIFKRNPEGYILYYIKRNELINENCKYYSATSADFDGDSIPEILISMNRIGNIEGELFSRIYKKTSTLSAQDMAQGNIPGFNLSDPYPNPFNSTTSFKFTVSDFETVHIKIFNVLGTEIKNLVSGKFNAGEYKISWDGKDNNGSVVPSGIYFISLSSNKQIKTKKIALLK
jgi:hypothetical protein